MNIALASIGCRTNQAENEALRSALGRAGYAVVNSLAAADVVIVNTCSVTAHTEAKVRRLLLSVGRQSQRAEILVTGCMVQHKAEELLRLPRVHWAVGNAQKHRVTEILAGKRSGIFLDTPGIELTVPQSFEAPTQGGRTRLNLKIQEGCNSACAYCIVPSLRGPERSAPVDDIIDSCRRAIDIGYKEIVLTGTHIGRFHGSNGERLHTLIERLLRLEGDFRIRLSSLDPAEATDGLLAMAGEGKKLCDHLHISLQSLSADVLRAMRRPHETLDALIEKLATFRAKYPRAGLGADFIVGFPGETDAQFLTTLDNTKKIGLSYAHIFRFSSRPGTAAEEMRPRVPEAAKQERSLLLRAAVDGSRRRFIHSQIGSVRRIIVEQAMPLRGTTSNYLAVEVSGASAFPNTWLNVIIESEPDSGRNCGARLLPQGRYDRTSSRSE